MSYDEANESAEPSALVWSAEKETEAASQSTCSTGPACPVCGGSLVEIRAKFQCSRCHRICETCFEGSRG